MTNTNTHSDHYDIMLGQMDKVKLMIYTVHIESLQSIMPRRSMLHLQNTQQRYTAEGHTDTQK
jgi:hypothetical protein